MSPSCRGNPSPPEAPFLTRRLRCDAGPLLSIDEAAKDALLVDKGAQFGADLAD